MRVFVLAGEASGDRLGAVMMAALNARETVEYTGVGGPLMAAQGLTSLFAMDELSVMGIAEILPKYRALKRRIADTAEAILRTKPDVVVTIDSPDFCFRVAAIVKDANPAQHITHYVAPSVWAWRPKRAAKLAKLADQVLCLLPFEPSYFTPHGLRADFVGHPVVADPQPTDQDISRFRAEYGLQGAPTVLVLPGSRKSEASRLLPVFRQTLEKMVINRPDLRVVTVAASGVADLVGDAAKHWPCNPVIIPAGESNLKRTAFAAANVALAASGTVSLELAAARTPMVIAYDMHWLTWQVMSRMATTDTATLVNLVSGTRHIPEFLGPACQPDAIAPALGTLLDDTEARVRQIQAMAQTMSALGQDGPSPGARAATALLNAIA